MSINVSLQSVYFNLFKPIKGTKMGQTLISYFAMNFVIRDTENQVFIHILQPATCI